MEQIADIQKPEAQSMLPLIQSAIAQGMDPEKLGKMMDLHQKWLDARAQEQFGSAIAAFQAECPRIQKKRKTQGAKFSFLYASLDDIDEVIRPILAKNGISVGFDSTHTVSDKSNVINVTVRLRVGSFFEDKRFGCPVPTDLNASQPQQFGAALSYAKRYAICAALNIVITDEDDDAASVVDTISAREMTQLEELIRSKKVDVAAYLKFVNSIAPQGQIEELADMPSSKFAKSLEALKQKK